MRSPLSAIPFIRFTTALICGILSAYYCPNNAILVAVILPILVSIYGGILRYTSSHTFYYFSPWLGAIGLLAIVAVGYLILWLHQSHHFPNHLVHHSSPIQAYVGRVTQKINSKEKHASCTVVVSKVRMGGTWYYMQGRVQLTIPYSTSYQPTYGDLLLVKGTPRLISPCRNPYALDYQNLARHQNIYHHHFVTDSQIVSMGRVSINPLHQAVIQLRMYCSDIITQYIRDQNSQNILLVMLLGIKEDLINTIRDHYAKAGVLHILAVSGLHVGILYLFLFYFYHLLTGRKRSLVKLVELVTILVIWCYAFVTGLFI